MLPCRTGRPAVLLGCSPTQTFPVLSPSDVSRRPLSASSSLVIIRQLHLSLPSYPRDPSWETSQTIQRMTMDAEQSSSCIRLHFLHSALKIVIDAPFGRMCDFQWHVRLGLRCTDPWSVEVVCDDRRRIGLHDLLGQTKGAGKVDTGLKPTSQQIHFFRKRALYYLIVIKLTPGLCITTMHTAHIQDVTKSTQAKLHIMMSNCNNAYQEEMFYGTFKWILAIHFRASDGSHQFILVRKTGPVQFILLHKTEAFRRARPNCSVAQKPHKTLRFYLIMCSFNSPSFIGN
jgi:hypothetical protein